MMQVKKIWQAGDIQLIQIRTEESCLHVVLINNVIVRASTDWDNIVKFMDRFFP